MLLRLQEYGNNLGTRFIGEKIREKISTNVNKNEKTILDFEDIDIISDSCADEIFSKLIMMYGFDKFKELTSFKNYNSNIGRIIINKINYAVSKMIK